MILYNLEGQPMEEIPDGSPVPPGRWTTPTGGAEDNARPLSGTAGAPQTPAASGAGTVQLYDLEGRPTEQIPAGAPIPAGRWATPTGGFESRNGGWGLGANTIDPATGQPIGTNIPGTPVREFQTRLNNANFGEDGPGGRNLAREATQAFGTQSWLTPQIFSEYAGLLPQVTQSNINNMGSAMFGQGWTGSLSDFNRQLTGNANAQTIASNNALRQGNINDVNQFGGDAMQAIFNLNPALYGNMDALDAAARNPVTGGAAQDQLSRTFMGGPSFGRVGDPSRGADVTTSPTTARTDFNTVTARTAFNPVSAAQSDFGLQTAYQRMGQLAPSGIQQTLESQAASDLALGRSLSPEDIRTSQQAAREGWGSRGLINSTGAVAEEVLNRDAMGRQREAQRRAFAQGVDQAGFGQRQAGLAGALGVSDAARGYAGLGLQGQMANLGATMQGNQLNLAGQQANLGAQLDRNRLDLASQQGNQEAGLRASLANQQRDITRASQLMDAQRANQLAQLQSQQQNQNLGLNLAQMNAQQQQQGFNNLNAASRMRADTFFNPFSILANSQNVGTNQNLAGQAAGAASGALTDQGVMSMFNPFNPYAQDVFNTNANAQSAANIARRNNNAALAGAGIGVAGNIIGALPWDDWFNDWFDFDGGAGAAGGGGGGWSTGVIGAQPGGSYIGNGGWPTGVGGVAGGTPGVWSTGPGGTHVPLCWVAREVYSPENPRWRVFRSWLMERAPDWFRQLYMDYGEDFAHFIKDKATLKAYIRLWMDARIEEYEQDLPIAKNAFTLNLEPVEAV